MSDIFQKQLDAFSLCLRESIESDGPDLVFFQGEKGCGAGLIVKAIEEKARTNEGLAAVRIMPESICGMSPTGQLAVFASRLHDACGVNFPSFSIVNAVDGLLSGKVSGSAVKDSLFKFYDDSFAIGLLVSLFSHLNPVADSIEWVFSLSRLIADKCSDISSSHKVSRLLERVVTRDDLGPIALASFCDDLSIYSEKKHIMPLILMDGCESFENDAGALSSFLDLVQQAHRLLFFVLSGDNHPTLCRLDRRMQEGKRIIVGRMDSRTSISLVDEIAGNMLSAIEKVRIVDRGRGIYSLTVSLAQGEKDAEMNYLRSLLRTVESSLESTQLLHGLCILSSGNRETAFGLLEILGLNSSRDRMQRLLEYSFVSSGGELFSVDAHVSRYILAKYGTEFGKDRSRIAEWREERGKIDQKRESGLLVLCSKALEFAREADWMSLEAYYLSSLVPVFDECFSRFETGSMIRPLSEILSFFSEDASGLPLAMALRSDLARARLLSPSADEDWDSYLAQLDELESEALEAEGTTLAVRTAVNTGFSRLFCGKSFHPCSVLEKKCTDDNGLDVRRRILLLLNKAGTIGRNDLRRQIMEFEGIARTELIFMLLMTNEAEACPIDPEFVITADETLRGRDTFSRLASAFSDLHRTFCSTRCADDDARKRLASLEKEAVSCFGQKNPAVLTLMSSALLFSYFYLDDPKPAFSSLLDMAEKTFADISGLHLLVSLASGTRLKDERIERLFTCEMERRSYEGRMMIGHRPCECGEILELCESGCISPVADEKFAVVMMISFSQARQKVFDDELKIEFEERFEKIISSASIPLEIYYLARAAVNHDADSFIGYLSSSSLYSVGHSELIYHVIMRTSSELKLLDLRISSILDRLDLDGFNSAGACLNALSRLLDIALKTYSEDEAFPGALMNLWNRVSGILCPDSPSEVFLIGLIAILSAPGFPELDRLPVQMVQKSCDLGFPDLAVFAMILSSFPVEDELDELMKDDKWISEKENVRLFLAMLVFANADENQREHVIARLASSRSKLKELSELLSMVGLRRDSDSRKLIHAVFSYRPASAGNVLNLCANLDYSTFARLRASLGDMILISHDEWCTLLCYCAQESGEPRYLDLYRLMDRDARKNGFTYSTSYSVFKNCYNWFNFFEESLKLSCGQAEECKTLPSGIIDEDPYTIVSERLLSCLAMIECGRSDEVVEWTLSLLQHLDDPVLDTAFYALAQRCNLYWIPVAIRLPMLDARLVGRNELADLSKCYESTVTTRELLAFLALRALEKSESFDDLAPAMVERIDAKTFDICYRYSIALGFDEFAFILCLNGVGRSKDNEEVANWFMRCQSASALFDDKKMLDSLFSDMCDRFDLKVLFSSGGKSKKQYDPLLYIYSYVIQNTNSGHPFFKLLSKRRLKKIAKMAKAEKDPNCYSRLGAYFFFIVALLVLEDTDLAYDFACLYLADGRQEQRYDRHVLVLEELYGEKESGADHVTGQTNE